MKVQPKPSCTAPIKGKTVGRKHTDASSENTSGAEPFGDADSIDIILPNAQDSRVVRLLRSASLGELLVDEFAKPISVSFAVLRAALLTAYVSAANARRARRESKKQVTLAKHADAAFARIASVPA